MELQMKFANKGIYLEDIVTDLYKDLKQCKLFIGYNLNFDINIIRAELFRYDEKYIDLAKKLDDIEKYDVMKNSIIMYD